MMKATVGFSLKPPKLTRLRLGQVLIWSHQVGGEERLRRAKVEEKAVGAEQKGRIQRPHGGPGKRDLHTDGRC